MTPGSNGEPARSVAIDAALVTRLVAGQFPQWSELPITGRPYGWDNRTFRLGDAMAVRLPSAAGYAAQVAKEHRWLPRLAPQLRFPSRFRWRWASPPTGIPGTGRSTAGSTVVATVERIANLRHFAIALAQFLNAYSGSTRLGAPPGAHNFYRGGPLNGYDAATRQALWRAVSSIPCRARRYGKRAHGSLARWPVWFHGDVAFGNLLVKHGRLSAVIDFGTSGVGDPACDLAIAWTLLRGESREAFRAERRLDEATWARGRGWTLWKALITFAGNLNINPGEAQAARWVINDVLAEYEQLS